MLVCRGCCCGTVKHPDVDHAAQVAALRDALPPDGRSRLWEVDCLGPCDRSNVVVVRSGGTRRWFGGVLDPTDTQALADWIAWGAARPPPAGLRARQFEPDAAGLGIVQPAGLTPDEIADFVHGVLSERVGAWSVGVEGAVAEFTDGGDPAQTRRMGRTVETATPRGGLRLVITDEARAFVLTDPGATTVIAVFVAVPRRALPEPTARLAIGLGDAGALRSEDRDGWVIDLGVGHATVRFCIRTGDPDLVARLRTVEGSTLRDSLDRVGAVIVERSPHRVVTTPLGRAEVYSPIPPPGSSSPDGPHTHLLLPTLELGRELPAGVALPPAWAVAASFHPPPGWSAPFTAGTTVDRA